MHGMTCRIPARYEKGRPEQQHAAGYGEYYEIEEGACWHARTLEWPQRYVVSVSASCDTMGSILAQSMISRISSTHNLSSNGSVALSTTGTHTAVLDYVRFEHEDHRQQRQSQ